MSTGWFRYKAIQQLAKWFLWLITLIIPIYIIYGLSPLADIDAGYRSALGSTAYKNFKHNAVVSVDNSKEDRFLYQYPLSSLVEIEIELYVTKDIKDDIKTKEFPTVRVKYDNLIILLGVFTIIILGIKFLFSASSSLYLHAKDIEISQDSPFVTAAEDIQKDIGQKETFKEISVIDLFRSDVAGAERRANNFFARSTLLLFGGIIMAFVGVAIFYITLPEIVANETIDSYIPKAIRPTGLLIFRKALPGFF